MDQSSQIPQNTQQSNTRNHQSQTTLYRSFGGLSTPNPFITYQNKSYQYKLQTHLNLKQMHRQALRKTNINKFNLVFQ